MVANYSSGTVACALLRSEGALGTVHSQVSAESWPLGPVKDRQDASHAHCATFSPDGKFVLACDLGTDSVRILPFQAYEGPTDKGLPVINNFHPGIGEGSRVAARAGSGPRHVAFHPNGKWLYCIHELDCTIDLFDWSVQAGKASLTLRAGSTISTLKPAAAIAGNTACEILVSDDGRFAYASTRGVDEITTYRIDPQTGLLTEQQRLKCGGKTPRHMTLDRSRRWLVCCNQAAPGSVTVFAHDPHTGMLDKKPRSFAANTPMFALWV